MIDDKNNTADSSLSNDKNDNKNIENKPEDQNTVTDKKNVTGQDKKKSKLISVNKGQYPEKSDEHMVTSTKLLDIRFDENYEYVIKKPLKKFFTTIFWGFATIVLKALNKIMYGFKVYGKGNLKILKKKKIGFISVSNHCHILDCTMVNNTLFPARTYLPTIHTTFQLPFIRHLVKGLNAIPIPEGIQAMSVFMNEMDNLLKNGKIIHFYPESALWPWYDKVREFKTGAFRFSVMNNVPVLPMAFKFQERKGIAKLFSKKPLVRLYILPPVYPEANIPKKQAINEICNKVHSIIKDFVEKN